MNRSKRTTKKQKTFIIGFLEENKILLGGKLKPLDLPKVNQLWIHLTNKLNEMGPPKAIKQWKDTISEMKTTVRRRAREVRYGHRGTGGGAQVKPLTDLEERLLSLTSKLSVEGADLIEAGVVNVENLAGPSTLPEESSIPAEGPKILAEVPSASEEILIENVPNVEIVFSETNEESLDNENNQNVENRKIEKPQKRKKYICKETMRPSKISDTITEHDKNLRELTKSNYAIAASIRLLAKAVCSLAKK